MARSRTSAAILLFATALSLAGCASGSRDDDAGSGGKVRLNGAVAKGPFLLGSTVNVSPVDAAGNPSGQVFQTQTTNNLGEFTVEFAYRGVVALEASGFYYNEISGELSASPIVLRAFANVSASGVQSAYVNTLTHLSFLRVRKLMAGGLSFQQASAQAEGELRTALAIGAANGATAAANEMNLLGGDNDSNAYLFAVSAVLIEVARGRTPEGGSVDASLQELLNVISLDFADQGTLPQARQAEIAAATERVDVDEVSRFLGRRLAAVGSAAAVPNLDRIFDKDKDGWANAVDNCPLVYNPDQETVTGAICDIAHRRSDPLPEGKTWWITGVNDAGAVANPSLVLFGRNTSGSGVDEWSIGEFDFGMASPLAVQTMSTPISGWPSLMDVDGDGLLDMMFGASYLPRSPAGFGPTPVSVVEDPRGHIVYARPGDFDGDGALDLAFSLIDNTFNVAVALGTGPGVFGPLSFPDPQVGVKFPNWREFLAVGNFFGKDALLVSTVERDPDTGDCLDDRLSLLSLGTDGSWTETTLYSSAFAYCNTMIWANVGDFDGDGNLDFHLVDTHNTVISRVYLNDGSGNFSSVDVEPTPWVAAVADLDGDGTDELIAAESFAEPAWRTEFSFYSLRSSGLEKIGGVATKGFTGVHIADVDGNGVPDLVSATNMNDVYFVIDVWKFFR